MTGNKDNNDKRGPRHCWCKFSRTKGVTVCHRLHCCNTSSGFTTCLCLCVSISLSQTSLTSRFLFRTRQNSCHHRLSVGTEICNTSSRVAPTNSDSPSLQSHNENECCRLSTKQSFAVQSIHFWEIGPDILWCASFVDFCKNYAYSEILNFKKLGTGATKERESSGTLKKHLFEASHR